MPWSFKEIITSIIRLSDSVPLPFVQLIIFPFIGLFVWYIARRFGRMPGWVALFGFGAALSAFSIGDALQRIKTSPIAISELGEDALGAKGRAYRRRIERLAHEASLGEIHNLEVSSFKGKIGTLKQANKYFRQHPDRRILVWGSPRWLMLSFRAEEPLKLGGLLKGSLGKLQFVANVSHIGFRADEEEMSPIFLGLMVLGKAQKSEFEAESIFRASANLPGRWPTRVHHSFAWFESSVAEVRDMVSEGNLSLGKVRCIKWRLERALAGFRPHDQSELFLAAVNNYAVVSILEGILMDKPNITQEMMTSLVSALKRVKKGALARKVIRHNLKAISAV